MIEFTTRTFSSQPRLHLDAHRVQSVSLKRAQCCGDFLPVGRAATASDASAGIAGRHLNRTVLRLAAFANLLTPPRYCRLRATSRTHSVPAWHRAVMSGYRKHDTNDLSGLIATTRRPGEGSPPPLRHTAGVHRRLLLQILHGASDAKIRFSDLTLLMRDLGFEERVRGSHHIFTR